MEISPTLNTILTLIGGISWTLVYILIIFHSFRDKTYGMPFWALAFNLSWEFIFSFVLPTHDPQFQIQAVINKIWLAFDVFVLAAYFPYGRKEWPQRLSGKLFLPYSLLVIAVSFLFVYLLSVELDQSQGKYAAFIQSLMMSVLFIAMLHRRNSKAGQSAYIAFLKMIGTLAFTIIYGAPSRFILFLGCACFVFDAIYFVLLLTVYRKAGTSA